MKRWAGKSGRKRECENDESSIPCLTVYIRVVAIGLEVVWMNNSGHRRAEQQLRTALPHVAFKKVLDLCFRYQGRAVVAPQPQTTTAYTFIIVPKILDRHFSK